MQQHKNFKTDHQHVINRRRPGYTNPQPGPPPQYTILPSSEIPSHPTSQYTNPPPSRIILQSGIPPSPSQPTNQPHIPLPPPPSPPLQTNINSGVFKLSFFSLAQTDIVDNVMSESNLDFNLITLSAGTFKTVKELKINVSGKLALTDVIYYEFNTHTLIKKLDFHLSTFVTYTNYDYIFLIYKTPNDLLPYIHNSVLYLKICIPKQYEDFRVITFLDASVNFDPSISKFRVNNIIYIHAIFMFEIERTIKMAMFFLKSILYISTNARNQKYIKTIRISPKYSSKIYGEHIEDAKALIIPVDNHNFPKIIDLIHQVAHIYKYCNILDVKDHNLGLVKDYFNDEDLPLLSFCDIDYYNMVNNLGRPVPADPYSIISNIDIKHEIFISSEIFNYVEPSNKQGSLFRIKKNILKLSDTIDIVELKKRIDNIQSKIFASDYDTMDWHCYINNITDNNKAANTGKTNHNLQISIDFKFLYIFYDVTPIIPYIDKDTQYYCNLQNFDIDIINPFITNFLTYILCECCDSDFIRFVKDEITGKVEYETIYYLILYVVDTITNNYENLYNDFSRFAQIKYDSINNNIFDNFVNYYFLSSKKRIENANCITYSIEQVLGMIYLEFYVNDQDISNKLKNMIHTFSDKTNITQFIERKYQEVHTKYLRIIDYQIKSIDFFINHNNYIEHPIHKYIMASLKSFQSIKKLYLETNKDNLAKEKATQTVLEYIKIIEFLCFSFYVANKGYLHTYVLSMVHTDYKIYHLFKRVKGFYISIIDNPEHNYIILNVKKNDPIIVNIAGNNYVIYIPEFEELEYIKFLTTDIGKMVNNNFILPFLFGYYKEDEVMPYSSINNTQSINSPLNFISGTHLCGEYKYNISYQSQNLSNSITNDLMSPPIIKCYIFKLNLLKLTNHNYLFKTVKYSKLISNMINYSEKSLESFTNLVNYSNKLNYYHHLKKKSNFSPSDYYKYLKFLITNITNKKLNIYLILPYTRILNALEADEISSISDVERNLLNILDSLDNHYLNFSYIPEIILYYKYPNNSNNSNNNVIINTLEDNCLELTNDLSYLIPLYINSDINNNIINQISQVQSGLDVDQPNNYTLSPISNRKIIGYWNVLPKEFGPPLHIRNTRSSSAPNQYSIPNQYGISNQYGIPNQYGNPNQIHPFPPPYLKNIFYS